MIHFPATAARPPLGRYCLWALLGGLVWAICLQPAWGQDSPQIVRVEEDWELVVATPDPTTDGPQVTTLISPRSHVGAAYATFELNHQSLPEYTAGGLQLQVWVDELPVVHRRFPSPEVMATPGETVQWTQSMALEDGTLTFEIAGGSSTTWGSFGGQGYLKATVPTLVDTLGAYHPSVSVTNSGIGYSANRVQSLVLKRVRLVTATGEVLEDDTPRPVYQQ
jgi:hypothetical protein